MKQKWNSNKYLTTALYAFIVICFSILFYFFVSNIGNIFSWFGNIIKILSPITLGLCFAYLFNPLLNKVEGFLKNNIKKLKNNKHVLRTVSMIITYLVIITLIILFLYIIMPQIASSLKYIFDNFPEYIDNLKSSIVDMSGKSDLFSITMSKILNYAEQFFSHTYTFLGETLPRIYDIAKNITVTLMNIVVGIVISVYILASKEVYFFQIRKLLRALFSRETNKTILGMVKSVHIVFSGFITGKIVDSIIIGIICFIGMSIFRFPFVPLISVLVGVTNVIPYFGPFIGALPSILLIMIVDPIKSLFFAIFVFVLQQFDGNYLGPKILGETTGLSPFWVIFSIILFGGIFGVLGMFVGVPIFAIIYSLIKCFINELLEDKEKKELKVQREKNFLDK
ncbi:MAG: AI-2E family transporter [Oscillospiraceae bacterium]|nr:AI-2E family transporter [Oscillospiraceae bacterium]